MELTLGHLGEIVATQAFERLIGEVENEFFDCKKEPYRISEEFAKRELAKDVSAFANSQGGYLFIGVSTAKSATHFRDEVTTVHPFDSTLVNCKQYEDIAGSWVYPAIEGLSVEWHPTEGSKGIVVLLIPPQPEKTKPFLVRKFVDGAKIVENIFGFSQRRGDGTAILPVEELQRTLRAGLNFESDIGARLSNLEILIERMATGRFEEVDRQKRSEQLDERITRCLEHEGIKNQRLLFLAACPSDGSQLRTVFSKEAGSIRRTLEDPPSLRYGGWDMSAGGDAHIIAGNFIRVAQGPRKVLDLYRDGTLIFAGLANSRFLAWTDERGLKLHPIAVIEVIYNFARLYEKVLEDFGKQPSSITFRIGMRNLHHGTEKSSLSPYPSTSLFGNEPLQAPADNWVKDITLPRVGYRPEVTGVQLVQELYFWFGYAEENVPYTKLVNGIREVDVERIAGLQG